MKCIFCGDEFEVNKKGRKRNYCTKIECKKKANALAQKKHFLTKKRKVNECKIEAEREIPQIKKIKEIIKKEQEEVITPKIQNEDEIIYSINDSMQNVSGIPDATELIEIGRQYGAIKFQLQELQKKETEKVSTCDKELSDLYHELEFMKEVKDSDSRRLTIKLKKVLERRRLHKDRIAIITGLLTSMNIKNPSQYVIASIQKKKGYAPRITGDILKEE